MAVTQLYIPPVPTDRPSLTVHSTAARLVQEFVQDVIEIRNEFHAGKPGAEDAAGRIEALAKDAGDVIMGRNPAFHVGEWQNPIRLGSKLRYLVDEPKYTDPGQAFFIWLSKQVLHSMISVEEGHMKPEESAQLLTPVMDDVVDRILGVK